MSEQSHNPIDRREMGRAALRWVLGCGIGGAAVAICIRNRGGNPVPQCAAASCRGCPSLAQCDRIEAAEARKGAR